MSFSASFLFQGQFVSDPFPAVSERGVGPTVKGTLKVREGKPWPRKEIRQ